VLPVFRDRALAAAFARGVLAGDKAEEGTQALRPEALPVAELDRECECGQRRDAPQADKTGDDVAEGRLGRELGDRAVEGVAPTLRLRDGAIALVEGERERPVCEALPAKPSVVGERPGGALEDEPVPQEQLREPLAGTHQIAACVLAGTHEITGCLLDRVGHAHRHELAQAQEPRQALGVAAVGLHSVTWCTRDLRGRCDRARDPCPRAGTREPVSGRPRLLGDPHRARQAP
jgi:hypothetical protein